MFQGAEMPFSEQTLVRNFFMIEVHILKRFYIPRQIVVRTQNQYISNNDGLPMLLMLCFSYLLYIFQFGQFSSCFWLFLICQLSTYLSINRCLSYKKKKNNVKERNYVANKSNVFFFFSFFSLLVRKLANQSLEIAVAQICISSIFCPVRC